MPWLSSVCGVHDDVHGAAHNLRDDGYSPYDRDGDSKLRLDFQLKQELAFDRCPIKTFFKFQK